MDIHSAVRAILHNSREHVDESRASMDNCGLAISRSLDRVRDSWVLIDRSDLLIERVLRGEPKEQEIRPTGMTAPGS